MAPDSASAAFRAGTIFATDPSGHISPRQPIFPSSAHSPMTATAGGSPFHLTGPSSTVAAAAVSASPDGDAGQAQTPGSSNGAGGISRSGSTATTFAASVFTQLGQAGHDLAPSSSNRSRRPSRNSSLRSASKEQLYTGRSSLSSRAPFSTDYQSIAGSYMMPPTAKRLKSQYPADSSQSHVDFILVASFDIDRGPVLEYQYPAAISGDEAQMAELMLPDQAHNRSQDWTIFFLHKDEDEEARVQKEESRRRREQRKLAGKNGQAGGHSQADDTTDSENEDFTDGGLEGPPLIYVLNLVNTKHDTSVKRGAICKAMAICTRHPFLHIYKPLLLLALEEYFKSPVEATLRSLYEAVNAMDLSGMPRFSLLERIILQASSAKDLFMWRFERMLQQIREDELRQGQQNAGGRATELTTRHSLPRDTHEYESRILYNGVSIPVKIPTARSVEAVGDFSLIKLIQTFSAPHASAPQPFALHPHLTTGGAFTHPIIVLVNALLTQKRIIFLGHNRPSGEVAEAVLAACALASGGLLRGFTRHAFPYTDLTKIEELLKVPGFIAGVTNPAFANHHEWWDLLCDLPSGRMKISSKVEAEPITEGLVSFQQQIPGFSITAGPSSSSSQSSSSPDNTGDTIFMDAVLRSISNRLGEGVIRSMWRDWIIKMTRVSAAFEEMIYGASALYIGGEEADAGAFGVKGHGYVWSDEGSRQRELIGNVHRIEGWRNTRSYYVLIQDLSNLYESRPIRSLDLHHHHDRLRTQKLSKDESAVIYLAFEKAVHSHGEISQLLTVTPEAHGGLFYISLGLLHPRKDVRSRTVELLERIMQHEAGRHFWESLGRFPKLAFFRLKRDMENSGDRGDDEDRENNDHNNFTSTTRDEDSGNLGSVTLTGNARS